jgi:hypothetical protein
MTARATFTEAELARAIRAAAKAGKVALLTRAGIVFVEPDIVPKTATEQPDEADTCAGKFGRQQ